MAMDQRDPLLGDLHLMSVLLCNGNKQHQLSPKAQFTSRSWIRGWNQEATYFFSPELLCS